MSLSIGQHFLGEKDEGRRAEEPVERINEAENGKEEAAQGIRDYFSSRVIPTRGMGHTRGTTSNSLQTWLSGFTTMIVHGIRATKQARAFPH